MKAAVLAVALCGVAACSSLTAPEIQVSGTVRYSPIEGGYFYIHADGGANYTPTSLPSCFKADGLPVQATLKIRKDLVSFVPGPLVDVKSISSPGITCAA